MKELYSDFNYDEMLQLDEWKAKRQEIIERDNYTCQRCGKKKDDKLSKLRGATISCKEIELNGIKKIDKTYIGTDIIEINFKSGKTLYAKTNLALDSILKYNELILTIQIADISLFNKDLPLSTIGNSEKTYFYKNELKMKNKTTTNSA
jgi:late competence protein required for DNA uptake (superfamily II DNA/RNA helicase)